MPDIIADIKGVIIPEGAEYNIKLRFDEKEVFYASELQRENQGHNFDGRIPEKETSDKETGRYGEDRPLPRSGCPQTGRVVIRVSPCQDHHRKLRQNRCLLRGGRRVYMRTKEPG